MGRYTFGGFHESSYFLSENAGSGAEIDRFWGVGLGTGYDAGMDLGDGGCTDEDLYVMVTDSGGGSDFNVGPGEFDELGDGFGTFGGSSLGAAGEGSAVAEDDELFEGLFEVWSLVEDTVADHRSSGGGGLELFHCFQVEGVVGV